MLKLAINLGVPFVFISSGAVFSTDNPNVKFEENYVKHPNCVYGYTKSCAEDVCLLYDKSIVIRTGWLFGGDQKNHYKFVDLVIRNLLLKTLVNASNNFFGSHTYVKDLVEHIKYLLRHKKYGLNHVVNEGISCGYDISRYIAEELKVDVGLVRSVASADIPNPGPYRGRSEILTSQHSYNQLRH